MATLIKATEVAVTVEDAWSAVAAFDELHERLLPGVVSRCRMDGDYRVLTFPNGQELRERFIGRDEVARRLAYTIENERYEHHNAALEVQATPDGRARLVWTVDVLPDALAAGLSERLDRTLEAMKATLSRIGDNKER